MWTLFDYLGEPSGSWPHVSSSFGQFDLAGFPKAQAHWYRNRWLLRANDSSAGKPFATSGNNEVHIVESWEPATAIPPAKCAVTKPGVKLNNSNYADGNGPRTAADAADCCSICAHTAHCGHWSFHINTSVPGKHCSWGSLTYCCWLHQAGGDIGMPGGGANPVADSQWTSGTTPPPWPPPVPVRTADKNMTVYSSASSVELLINGASLGKKVLPAQQHTVGAPVVQSWAEWDDVKWTAGNATAVARNAKGEVVAVDTRVTCGSPQSIVLSLDAPSPRTGTGTALLADGVDAALVRATVVDSAGNVRNLSPPSLPTVVSLCCGVGVVRLYVQSMIVRGYMQSIK